MKLFDLDLSRTIDASPDEVFSAWLDPARFKIWMGCVELIMNPKVDGLFHIGVGHNGPDCKIYGRYLRLDRPRLIEHTWMSQSTHGHESRVSVSLEPNAKGTQLTLIHTGLPNETEASNHLRGWTTILGRIEEHRAVVSVEHDRSQARE